MSKSSQPQLPFQERRDQVENRDRAVLYLADRWRQPWAPHATAGLSLKAAMTRAKEIFSELTPFHTEERTGKHMWPARGAVSDPGGGRCHCHVRLVVALSADSTGCRVQACPARTRPSPHCQPCQHHQRTLARGRRFFLPARPDGAATSRPSLQRAAGKNEARPGLLSGVHRPATAPASRVQGQG
jgi:hypothetical protein